MKLGWVGELSWGGRDEFKNCELLCFTQCLSCSGSTEDEIVGRKSDFSDQSISVTASGWLVFVPAQSGIQSCRFHDWEGGREECLWSCGWWMDLVLSCLVGN